MKYHPYILLLIFVIQLAAEKESFAQKTIKIDPELKASAQPLTVKRKGVSSVGKYEFGQYKIISGKEGLTKGSSNAPLFGDHTSIKSSKEMSFVFINDKGDTSVTNIRVVENIETDDGNWLSRTFLNWTDSDVKKGEGVFEAVFSFSSDSTPWTLALIYPASIQVDASIGEFDATTKTKFDATTTFRGAMTDGVTTIEIRQVNEADGGKNQMNPVSGYEFWQGPKSIGALQVLPINKALVWIRDDLDAKLKFVLANGATALLVKTF